MKAIYFEAYRSQPRVAELPTPKCPSTGVVVKVAASGICRSDWHGWMGHDDDVRLPHVPGHEFAGTIVEQGRDVRRWEVGSRITVPFSMGCGNCPQCRSQNHQICDNYYQPGFTAWGSFAEYIALPNADVNLVALPDSLEFVHAASLGCRFVTAYRAIVSRARLKPNEWLAVHGCGGVGLSAVMIGASLGAKVIGVDVCSQALTLAKSLGAAETIDARDVDVVSSIKCMAADGVHVSIDALGSRKTCLDSISALRKQGRHVQVGLMAEDDRHCAALWPQIIAKELEILGSHGISPTEYESLFRMIEMGNLDLGNLVRAQVNLQEAIHILTGMGNASPLGVVVINDFS